MDIGEMLRKVLAQGEFLFLIIFMVGSGVASWLKARKEREARAEMRRIQQEAREAHAEWEADQEDEPAEEEAPAAPPSTPPVIAQTAAPKAPAPGKRRKIRDVVAQLEGLFEPVEGEEAGLSRRPAAPPARERPRSAPRMGSGPMPPLAPLPPSGTRKVIWGALGESIPEFTSGFSELQDSGDFEGAAALPAFESAGIEPLSTWSGMGTTSLSQTPIGADTGAAPIFEGEGWRPSASWRDAIVLREILDPPRAYRGNDLPGFSNWEG